MISNKSLVTNVKIKSYCFSHSKCYRTSRTTKVLRFCCTLLQPAHPSLPKTFLILVLRNKHILGNSQPWQTSLPQFHGCEQETADWGRVEGQINSALERDSLYRLGSKHACSLPCSKNFISTLTWNFSNKSLLAATTPILPTDMQRLETLWEIVSKQLI